MSDFEKAFSKLSKVSLENHTELWGEPKTERAFFEAGQASKQAKIDGLKKKIEDQIDLLKEASKSHAYNYREQNIMLSQADDLEKILRGEHE